MSFTNLEKHELMNEYQERQRIGYSKHADFTLIHYEYREPFILGIRLAPKEERETMRVRPYVAKVQPKGFFVVNRKYFAVDDIEYYPDTPDEKRIKVPGKDKPPVSFPKSLMERVQYNIARGRSDFLTAEEMQQLLKERPDVVPGLPSEGKPIIVDSPKIEEEKEKSDDLLANNILTVKHSATGEIEKISERELKNSGGVYYYSDVIEGTPLDGPKKKENDPDEDDWPW
jgi:hypothetical protein